MPKYKNTCEDLIAEIEQLRLRLEEAEETLEAIRNGEVDALVVSGTESDQVYTLDGSDRAYRILFETMNEGAAILGSDGTVLFCNGKLTAMLRAPMETILGGSIFPFVTEKCAPVVADLLEKGLQSSQKMEITLKSRDGTLVPCQISSSPFLVEDAANICVIFTDLTERKQVEANLIRSNKDLAQFAYVASHDLQEPLRNVINCLQILEKKYKHKLEPGSDQYIYHAVESSKRMKALIQDLLTYSRIETQGKEHEHIESEEVFRRTIQNLASAISETQAEITHDPLPRMAADTTQLLQVFQNLIGNAIKFRSKRPPRIHVSAAKNNREWIFSVRDNGIGIDPRYSDKIFMIFQRLNKRSEYEGTGMGLAIVKKIIERHSGRVWMESTIGEGSTFYFTITNIQEL
jgi:PAS domain S-box-containing protein